MQHRDSNTDVHYISSPKAVELDKRGRRSWDLCVHPSYCRHDVMGASDPHWGTKDPYKLDLDGGPGIAPVPLFC